jgi:hypothetical protein
MSMTAINPTRIVPLGPELVFFWRPTIAGASNGRRAPASKLVCDSFMKELLQFKDRLTNNKNISDIFPRAATTTNFGRTVHSRKST